jgi:hypothetical protein
MKELVYQEKSLTRDELLLRIMDAASLTVRILRAYKGQQVLL